MRSCSANVLPGFGRRVLSLLLAPRYNQPPGIVDRLMHFERFYANSA
jgi:hypothetical protein